MRKILLFLGVLLLTLGLVVGSASAVLTVVTDADKTYIDWQSAGVSVFKIDDTDGVTISVSGNFTLTSPVVASNAVYGLINAGSAWAIGGNLVGLRGKVNITAAGNTGSATGVWAGIAITSASVQRFGLQVGLNVEAYSNTICLPNAVLYIQSLPSGSTTDFSDTPYLVFSETVSGSATGSNILFEVGHSWADTVPTIGTGKLFYNHTLQIAVNESAGTRTSFFIPLSTVEGTYTTEYLIDVTVASGTAIDIGTSVIGINFSGTYSTAAIAIGTVGKITFYDAAVNIYAADDGDMVINADATLIITSPTTEIAGTTLTLDAATSISLEAGAGTYGITATAITLPTGTDLVITQGSLDLSSAATGTAYIKLNDNVADALSIVRDSTDMIVFDSSTPKITITPATTISGDLTLSGNVGMANDKKITIGTTVTNAETKVTIEFEETTSGIGFIKIGDLSNSQVLNLNPGATIVPLSVVVTHSAATGNCDDYVGIYTKFTISGDGDTGLTGVPLVARLYVNAPISQAYAFQNKAWKQSTDDVTAMAVSSVSLMIQNAFEATQTLNVAEFFLDSDQARTVTCTSENFNMVLIKNNGEIAGLNSLMKLVSAGADNPGSIIHVEGATDNGFIQFDSGSDCVADTDATGANATHKIKCRFDNVTFYIAGFADF